MARTLRDEILRWTLVVNGDSAKKELNDLSRANAEVAAKIRELEKESRRMERSGDTKKKRYKEITAELKQLNATYAQNDQRIKSLQAELGVTGKTMAQLRKEARDLRHQLANTVPGTEAYKELQDRLNQVTGRMDVLNGKSGSLRASFQRLADGANKYFNLFAVGVAAITGFVLGIREMITANTELADQQANVMKTTGLTISQVRTMQGEFKKFNTRTPQMELLALAEEAGRLGKTGKYEILEFVRTADMLKVALGDDLGGEEAIREVGKLTEQFDVGTERGVSFGVAMEKLGSAINKVSASGTNMAPFLVDFMKRVAGIDGQVKMGASNIIGYAAALDEAGQSAEVGGTVFNNLLPSMFKDPATYARIARMEVAEFANLLKTDANEAMLRFLEGLKGNGEGFEVMARKMEELKLDGARSVSVLASLANNTDKVRERQITANEAMEKGTSLSEEFAIKNENLAASYEKLTKWMRGTFLTSFSLTSMFEKMFGTMAKWIEVPLSEKLEEERVELRMVEMQLMQTNIKGEDRLKLINHLKQQYPAYLAQIDAEKVSNQELQQSIAKINNELINKIILQKNDEKIQEQNERIAKKRMAVIEAENKLRQKAIEMVGKEGKLPEGTDLLDQLHKVSATLKENELFRGALFNPVLRFRQDIQQYELMLRNLNAMEREGNEMLNERNELIERLGLQMDEAARKSLQPADPGAAFVESENERGERIKKQREERDNAHKNLLRDVDAFLKNESAIHAEARARNLMTEDQYQEGLRMMQLTGFRMRSDALKSYLATLSTDEIDKRAEVNGQLADIRREAAEWEIADTQDFHTWAEAELKKHFDELDAINEQGYERLKAGNAQRRRDALVGAELNVIKATPGTRDELNARKELLDVQMNLELENTRLTEAEKEKIILQYQQQRKQLDREYFNNYAQVALQSIGAIASNYVAYMNSRDQKELDEDRRVNDEKKENLLRMLDKKQISEESYRTQLAALEDKQRTKEREIKTEQFKRQRAADAIQAGINTALAITKALPNIPLSIAAGLAGAAQVGFILAQPVPAFKEGKYDVTTTEGKKYNANYSGPVKTGIYSKPTLGLFSEEGTELIISAPHLKHMQMNYPEIIEAIMYTRMPAYARGKYASESASSNISGGTSGKISVSMPSNGHDLGLEIIEQLKLSNILLTRLYDKMEESAENPVPAELSWRQYNEFKDKATTIESKYGV